MGFHSVTSPFFCHCRAIVLGRSNTHSTGRPLQLARCSAKVRTKLSTASSWTKLTRIKREYFRREAKKWMRRRALWSLLMGHSLIFTITICWPDIIFATARWVRSLTGMSPITTSQCSDISCRRDFGRVFTSSTRSNSQQLAEFATRVDEQFTQNTTVKMGADGLPVLLKYSARVIPESAQRLHLEVMRRMPQRSLLDILVNVEHLTNFTNHFGPASDSEPKIERAAERYLLTIFAIGSSLGPVQAARHLGGVVTAHMLSFANRKHVTVEKLEASRRELIEFYLTLDLPKAWGKGTAQHPDRHRVLRHTRPVGGGLCLCPHVRYPLVATHPKLEEPQVVSTTCQHALSPSRFSLPRDSGLEAAPEALEGLDAVGALGSGRKNSTLDLDPAAQPSERCQYAVPLRGTNGKRGSNDIPSGVDFQSADAPRGDRDDQQSGGLSQLFQVAALRRRSHCRKRSGRTTKVSSLQRSAGLGRDPAKCHRHEPNHCGSPAGRVDHHRGGPLAPQPIFDSGREALRRIRIRF